MKRHEHLSCNNVYDSNSDVVLYADTSMPDHPFRVIRFGICVFYLSLFSTVYEVLLQFRDFGSSNFF
jgi:hypothetical protein